MSDWFGDTPVEIQEYSPSHYYNWRDFCNFCDSQSIVYFEGKYLCVDHADEILMEMSDV